MTGVRASQAGFADEAEIVVIGAGPAGASTAATLAEYGHEVLVIDKNPFPRDKACGDGLTRSAVAFLRRHGLGDLVEASQPIEGGRAVFSHGHEELKLYSGERGACVPRFLLDDALLDAALGLGARSVTARVTRPLMGGCGVTAVEVDQDGGLGRIGGRYFVAADGPSSIIRQRLGVPKARGALSVYAVRQYFEVECALDPLFDIYLPLTYQNLGLVGYGWVFPVSAHRANIGVGYYRGPDPAANPPIRPLLDEFVRGLRENQAQRFGMITPVGKQFGSPLGVNFTPELCELDNVMFVGDAARMTDPVSGEGIAIALQAGEELARHLHRLITTKAATHSLCLPTMEAVDNQCELGRRLGRISPRLGQNLSMPVSVARQAVSETPERLSSVIGDGKNSLWSAQPFLWSVREILVSGSGAQPITCPPGLAGNFQLMTALTELSRRAEAELRTTFPFLYELVHRRLHDDDGPMLAVALLSSVLAVGGVPGKRELDLALGCELLDLFPDLAGQVVDRPARTRDTLNNAFAVIAGDFVLAQAFRLISPVGAARVARLARCAAVVCEGAMSEAELRRLGVADPDRPLAAAQERSASLYSLACQLGGELGGASAAISDALAEYGRAVGMALRIAADLRLLCPRDSAGPDPELAARASNVGILIGLGAAADLCGSYSSRAKDALRAVGEPCGGLLHGLADFALRSCRQAIGDLPRGAQEPAGPRAIRVMSPARQA